MSAKEKALELFDTFQQYEWDDEKGYIPSDKLTKSLVNKVIDEIELQSENWGVVSVLAYWIKVRNNLKDL